MKRFVSVALVLVMLLAAMPISAFAEYDYPYEGDAYGVDFEEANLDILAKDDVIVLLGDSLTHGSPLNGYSNVSWVVQFTNYLITRFPHLNVRLVNLGIGGISTIQAAQYQISADYSDHEYTKAIMYLGSNDGNANYVKDKVTKAYNEILDFIESRGATTIALLTPTGVDYTSGTSKVSGHDNAVIEVLCEEIMETIGSERNIAVVNQYAEYMNTLNNYWIRDKKMIMQSDRIHPSAKGSAVTFAELIDALDLPGEVATVVLNAENGEVVTQSNCAVTETVFSDGTIEYTYLANALPFYKSNYVSEAMEIMDYIEMFSRETLKVEGLAEGTYKLVIDGKDIAELTSDELSNGINLTNYDTPMVEQSKQTADKIFALTEEMTAIRDLERVEYLARSKSISDDYLIEWLEYVVNKGLNTDGWLNLYKRYLEETKEKSMDERWAGMDTLWDAAYEAAQPTSHKVEIVTLSVVTPDVPAEPSEPVISDTPEKNLTPVIICAAAVVVVAAAVVLVVLKKKKK